MTMTRIGPSCLSKIMAERISVRGQVHELRPVLVDHLNRRGEIAELRLIRSRCAECGAPFVQWRTAAKLEQLELTRRCKPHRSCHRVRSVHPAAAG